MIYDKRINTYQNVILQQETDYRLACYLADGYKIAEAQVQADKDITEIAFLLCKSEEFPIYEPDEP